MLLKDIYGTKVMEYKNLRLASPIMRYKKPVPDTLVKASTVNRELSCLHRMLKLAAADHVIETVPVIEFESEKHLARERTLSDECRSAEAVDKAPRQAKDQGHGDGRPRVCCDALSVCQLERGRHPYRSGKCH